MSRVPESKIAFGESTMHRSMRLSEDVVILVAVEIV
jgi:hypothetical protein